MKTLLIAAIILSAATVSASDESDAALAIAIQQSMRTYSAPKTIIIYKRPSLYGPPVTVIQEEQRMIRPQDIQNSHIVLDPHLQQMFDRRLLDPPVRW